MLLRRKTFFIKEQVEFMKFSGIYDIYDPETNIQIGVAKEESGTLTKILKLILEKRFLPVKFVIYDSENSLPIAEIKNSPSFFRSKITVTNQNRKIIGYFQSKILTLVGGFMVFDSNNNRVAEIKGTWTSWDFKFLDSSGIEIGTITKKWAGLGKELFTTADNYMISLNNLQSNEDETALLLAAGLAIDVIFKERK